MNIPISRPFFGEEERQAVQQPLATGWVVQGPYVQRFEQRFSAFSGAERSIATSSCTTALHIAVAALKLKPGDEVIVPAFTWVATANVVEYMGAKPVFCDVDLATFNLDWRELEGLVTPRTVGLLPVHLFGLCAEMEPILAVARKHRLWVAEDAACAFGAWYQGKHAGTFGEMGCFSFHPRKAITTGEGGLITTGRSDLEEACRSLRDHGASRSDHARHTQTAGFLLAEYNLLGYNFRMTDIQGALGCAQMDRAEWLLAERKRLAGYYDRAVRDRLPWLEPPRVDAGQVHGYQSYVCLFRPEEPTLANVEALHERRNRVMVRVEERGIATRQGTHAPVLLGYYSAKYGYKPEQFPRSYLADRLSLTLPLYAGMTGTEQDSVVSELSSAYAAS